MGHQRKSALAWCVRVSDEVHVIDKGRVEVASDYLAMTTVHEALQKASQQGKQPLAALHQQIEVLHSIVAVGLGGIGCRICQL